MDYFTMAYNGYWDGYWESSHQGIREIGIQDDREARANFMRGWNTAVREEQANL